MTKTDSPQFETDIFQTTKEPGESIYNDLRRGALVEVKGTSRMIIEILSYSQHLFNNKTKMYCEATVITQDLNQPWSNNAMNELSHLGNVPVSTSIETGKGISPFELEDEASEMMQSLMEFEGHLYVPSYILGVHDEEPGVLTYDLMLRPIQGMQAFEMEALAKGETPDYDKALWDLSQQLKDEPTKRNFTVLDGGQK